MKKITEEEKKVVNDLSNAVNNCCANLKTMADCLARDHRYLVGKHFDMAMYFLARLARDYKENRFDDRNERACRVSKKIMDYLVDNDIISESRYGLDGDDPACSVEWVDM